LPPAGAAFAKWFLERRQHHEFPELETRLTKLSHLTQDQLGVELYVFWNAWRAASYDRDELITAAINQVVKKIRSGGADSIDPKDVPMSGFHHGPFIWLPEAPPEDQLSGDDPSVTDIQQPLHPPLAGKTRLPTPGTLLAAQVAYLCNEFNVPADWIMIEKLVAVAGIEEDTERTNLRVRARKLLKAVETGTVKHFGCWPQDTGMTLGAFEEFVTRMPTP
jgi:hypothetical protein